jgi:hypothetical protein
MKRLILIVVLGTVVLSCNVKQSEEYKQLVSMNLSLKKEIDSLNNTPDRIFYRGLNYFKNENLDSALVEFNKIKSLYEGSEFFNKANLKINEGKRIIAKREKEKELRLKLKFKALKEQQTFETDNLTIRTFGHNFTSRFDFDRYGDRYHYREAKRGYKYLSFDAEISSETNTPMIPAFYVYVLTDGVLKRISKGKGIGIEFYRWDDYGSYLGNDADYSNDFQRTKTIRFDLGEELKTLDYKGKEVYIVATKIGRMYKEASLRNPPISYETSLSYKAPIQIETPDNFDSEFILVKKIKP